MLSLRTSENLNLKYQLVLFFESAVGFVLISLLNSYLHVHLRKKFKDPALTLQKLVPCSTAQQRNEIFSS